MLMILTTAFGTTALFGPSKRSPVTFANWWDSDGFVVFIVLVLVYFALVSMLGITFPSSAGAGNDY